MAVKAFANIIGVAPNVADTTKVDVDVHLVLLGGAKGTYENLEPDVHVIGLDPSTRNTITNAITAAITTDLASHGLALTGNDTIFLY